MAKEYLDKSGLTYLWGKLKAYFQEKLVSGTNIKTINNQSVLGSGNITIQGSSGVSDVTIDGDSIVSSGVATISSMTKNEYETGTETAAKLISPATLAAAIVFRATPSKIGAVPTTRTVNSKALSSNITLSASDVGALPTSGGNITGNLSYKSSTIDASLANNNVSSTQYPTTFNILDKSGRILTRKEAVIESGGNISAYWYVRNYNTSGTQVGQKGIKITMNKSGAVTYAVDEPDKFLSAISAVPTSRTVNGKALSANITLKATDLFIFDTYSKSVTVPGSGAYNFTMGALTQHSGYTLRGYINQNGGYTDQWLTSYGTYGSNVVAMIYSKYGSSLTSTISCVAVWTKN